MIEEYGNRRILTYDKKKKDETYNLTVNVPRIIRVEFAETKTFVCDKPAYSSPWYFGVGLYKVKLMPVGNALYLEVDKINE